MGKKTSDDDSKESEICLEDITFLKKEFSEDHPLVDEAFEILSERDLKFQGHKTERRYLEIELLRLEAYRERSPEKYKQYVKAYNEYCWEQFLKRMKKK